MGREVWLIRVSFIGGALRRSVESDEEERLCERGPCGGVGGGEGDGEGEEEGWKRDSFENWDERRLRRVGWGGEEGGEMGVGGMVEIEIDEGVGEGGGREGEIWSWGGGGEVILLSHSIYSAPSGGGGGAGGAGSLGGEEREESVC